MIVYRIIYNISWDNNVMQVTEKRLDEVFYELKFVEAEILNLNIKFGGISRVPNGLKYYKRVRYVKAKELKQVVFGQGCIMQFLIISVLSSEVMIPSTKNSIKKIWLCLQNAFFINKMKKSLQLLEIQKQAHGKS